LVFKHSFMKNKKREAADKIDVGHAPKTAQAGLEEVLPAQCPLCHLHGGARPQLCDLAELGQDDVRFDRHRSIVKEGERIKSYYVIRSGWGGAYSTSRNGQFMRLLLPGDLVAFEAIGQQTWPFQVRSLTPILACELDSKAFVNALGSSLSRYLPSLLRAWAQHSRDQHRALVDLSASSAAKRLLSFLSHVYSELQLRVGINGHAFPFPLSRDDVALALGMAPVHVSRMVNQLRRLGIVDVTYGRVYILDQSRFLGG